MICKYCKAEIPAGAAYCCACGKKQEPERRIRTRGNGTGTAFYRRDRRCWVAQATYYEYIRNADGTATDKVRRRRTQCGFRTKKEAILALPALSAVREVRRAPKLIDLWNQFEAAELLALSPSRQTAHRIAFDRFKGSGLMERRIDTLTTAELQLALSGCASTYYTARDVKAMLSKLYQLAMQDGFVAVNAAMNLALPPLEDAEAEPFTEAEVRKIWSAYAAGDRFAAYLLLMIYSGMMPGELLACRVDMIDRSRREIFGCGKKTTKRKKEAPIIYAAALDAVVADLIAGAEKGKLYAHRRDRFYEEYHEATARIGIRDLPPYSCRHTTGTAAAKENITASVIQQIMRHSRIATSQRYIHIGGTEAHAGIDSIAQQTKKALP